MRLRKQLWGALMLSPVFQVTCTKNGEQAWVGVKALVVNAVLHKDGILDGYPEWSEYKMMQRFLHRECSFFGRDWHIKELTEL